MPGKVVIIGGGVVWLQRCTNGCRFTCRSTILDHNPAMLNDLINHFEASAKVIYSNKTVLEMVARADLVIGAVLIPGAATPKLVSEMLGTMKNGAVLVDVAIDQGGCFETSKATTHASPTYVVDGPCTIVLPTCRAPSPGPQAYALNNVTLQHAVSIANRVGKGSFR